jgi:phosphoenolpyruvate-protein phosphotransferase
MSERVLHGAPASPGIAVGPVWQHAEVASGGATLVESEDREREQGVALSALAAAAEALMKVAAGLPAEEAEIVETGALMAHDPALIQSIEAAIGSDGLPAADAILRVTGEYADAIASIGDELLAARADDVRSLGRRAARLTRDGAAEGPPGDGLILVAHDLGPADVAELASALAGIALSGGAATAHAAIVARSLGIPMLTGVDEEVLLTADGEEVVLDGTAGTLVVEPSHERAEAASNEVAARRRATVRAHADRDKPAITTDGRQIAVLANVASPGELDAGVAAGAEGIGLLRTELAFLDASDWPDERRHIAALEPILAGLGSRPAVIRVLDFGADKAPPFLHGVPQRGLELLLAHPEAFRAQLRAILRCAQDRNVRIMVPMVDRPEQLAAARALLSEAAAEVGVTELPPFGSMIETPLAVENAAALAAQSDFFSIGTNDLTASTLGADRFAANGARAYHPAVLRSIARSVEAAHAAGISIEVCGEAGSDPVMLPLLVGLGVDELSVGAARVGEVRRWIRELQVAEAATFAQAALAMASAEEVARGIEPLASMLQAEASAPGAIRLAS